VEGTRRIKSLAALRKTRIALLDTGERIEHAGSMDALKVLQDEFDAVLRGAVMGLRDDTISNDGLNGFRLATSSCAMKSQCAARACDDTPATMTTSSWSRRRRALDRADQPTDSRNRGQRKNRLPGLPNS
jgi:hypothetical protein